MLGVSAVDTSEVRSVLLQGDNKSGLGMGREGTGSQGGHATLAPETRRRTLTRRGRLELFMIMNSRDRPRRKHAIF